MGQLVAILDRIRDALVGILIALAMTAMTYAGVRYVIAGGDPGGVERAKGAAKSAVVGLALAMLAPLLISIVQDMLKQ